MSNNITIIVPVRNRADLIERTLDSIANQTWSDFNLIIVDNNSTDATADIIEQWIEAHDNCNFKIDFYSQPKIGAAAARNLGLSKCATDYVMFFDSDDVMLPTHLDSIKQHIDRFNDADIIRWDIAEIDTDGWMKLHGKIFHDEMQLHLMHCSLSTQRYIVKTAKIQNIGGWNENLSTWDDWELGVRLIASGCKIRKINGEPTVHVYHSVNSLTGNSFSERHSQQAKALQAVENSLLEMQLSDDIVLLLARKAILAACYRREKNSQLSNNLLHEALNVNSVKTKLKLYFIYLTQRIIGSGGSRLALYLLGKKMPKT